MEKHTRKYLTAHQFIFDEFSGSRPYVPSELGGRCNDLHHIKYKGRRVDSICALMALTTEQHKQYGERGKDEELIKVHFEFLRNQMVKGIELMPIILMDIEEYDCELSKRFVRELEDIY